MVRLDPTSVKLKEEMARFRNNLLVPSYEKATCSMGTLDRWLSVLFSKGIRIWPHGRMNEFVYMCVLGGVKMKCLVSYIKTKKYLFVSLRAEVFKIS